MAPEAVGSPVVSDHTYSNVWRRFWARGVDLVVVGPLLALPIASSEWQLPLVAEVTFVATCAFCVTAYGVLMHWRFGATLGKLAFGICVVDPFGNSLSLRKAMLRDAVYIALNAYSLAVEIRNLIAGSALITGDMSEIVAVSQIVVAVEILTALTNSKRRSLHDFIAGTVVIRREARRRLASRPAVMQP